VGMGGCKEEACIVSQGEKQVYCFPWTITGTNFAGLRYPMPRILRRMHTPDGVGQSLG
jgi:hypothetical protein